jgi:hypothetical protein
MIGKKHNSFALRPEFGGVAFNNAVTLPYVLRQLAAA